MSYIVFTTTILQVHSLISFLVQYIFHKMLVMIMTKWFHWWKSHRFVWYWQLKCVRVLPVYYRWFVQSNWIDYRLVPISYPCQRQRIQPDRKQIFQYCFYRLNSVCPTSSSRSNPFTKIFSVSFSVQKRKWNIEYSKPVPTQSTKDYIVLTQYDTIIVFTDGRFPNAQRFRLKMFELLERFTIDE